MEVQINRQSWENFNDIVKERKLVILPIGSTEQHGLHLPLGTDTYLAISISEDAAKKTNVPVAPPLWFGWSPHHMVLPGTITIRPEVLIEFVYDILCSFNEHGIEKVILVNGHRLVNIPWMQIVAERAQRLLGLRVKIFDPAYMSKELVHTLGFGNVGHADEIESSEMLYKFPDLFKKDKIIDFPPTEKDLYHIDPAIEKDTLCYVPSTKADVAEQILISKGVVGYPSKSSAEKGKIYHDYLVNRLVEVINNI